MSDIEPVVAERSASGAFIAAVVVAVLLGVGGLIWCYSLQSRLAATEATEQKLAADTDKNSASLAERLDATNARLSATTETLSQNVGATQKQIDARAAAIMAEQKAQNAETARLAQQQKAAEQQIGAVSSDVASVKTDVGGVKTDVATTRSDLENTKSQLQRVVGDAGVMSGLIATNHSELEELKHKGDRNYYEFTLAKGQRKPVGTVSLELRKTDPKRNRFTLEVYADDKVYEKKDRNVNEPLQFYSGKDPALYEIVVNSISSKNSISGYLSTPKGAPAPVQPSGQ
jgi:hypothetical protein